MKINLLDVNISAFQNISENQYISFDTPGLYGIIGKNLDDGGSNASGKSSFVRAITVGLLGTGVVPITNKEIKNRILGLPAKIKLKLTINNQNVEVIRIIGGKLIVLVNGVELSGKTDEIQQKLLSLLGISADHFLHLTYKMQESFGGFLLMKDAEKKEFLGSFFDTKKLEKVAAENEAEIKQINTQIIHNAERLRILTSGVNALKAELDILQQKVLEYTSTDYLSALSAKKSDLAHIELELKKLKDITPEMILAQDDSYNKLLLQKAELTQQYQSLEVSYSLINSQLTQQANQIKIALSEPVSVPTQLTEALDAINLKLKTRRDTNNTAVQYQTYKNNLEYQINQTKNKIQNLKIDTCITCGQPIGTNIYNQIKEKLELEVSLLSDNLNKINTQISTLESSITMSEDEMNQIKQSILSEIANFKASNNQTPLKQTLNNIENKLTLNSQKLQDINRNIAQTDSLLVQMQQMIEENHRMQIKANEAELIATQKDISILEQQADDTKHLFESVTKKYAQQLKELQDLERISSEVTHSLAVRSKISEILSRNGFMGYIFDNILEEINREVNENIKMIPVIARLSMYFSPDKTIKTTGNTNKAIVYRLFDNYEEISFETLSGSEKESLLLATDAAVDTVLCSRLGVDINYKILDEQFGWVDENNKEYLLKFIRQKYPDKIIMIIDHGSELNAAIDKKIIITKQSGLATVSCLDVP